MVGAHGQFPAQDLLAVFAVDCDYRDVTADAVANLQGFLDRVVIRLIYRVHEFVALNVVSDSTEFDLVLRGIRHSSRTNQNFHIQPPQVAVSNSSVGSAQALRTMCWSTSSVRSITDILPSMPATLMASSMLTMQNGHAVTITFAPASAAMRTRTTPILC